MAHAESGCHRPIAPSATAGHGLTVWLAYIVFVVYGSLVPLDFHPMSLDLAWAAFKQTPMLHIGIEGRADWIANGVLYVPVGFLTLVVIAGRKASSASVVSVVGAAVFCFSLDVAVEFTQLFFPPRTVSRNDVIAEGIGSAFGIAIALYGRKWYQHLIANLQGAYDQLVDRLLEAYAIGYLGFAFFPFDLVLSATEFSTKLNSDSWGWFVSGQSTSRGAIVLIAKLFAETLAVMPLGLMLGRWNASRQAVATRHALPLGLILGLTIEVGQLFVFSGNSQGVSLLTRVVGMYSGAILWRKRTLLGNPNILARSKRLIAPLGLIYVLALLTANGWFDHTWLDLVVARNTFAQTSFLPFYYHYFTTEQAALVSLISVALMYSPFGVLGWLRGWSPAMVQWTAAIVGVCMESSKLFLAGLHPDPTNILIGCVAAGSVTRLLQRLQVSLSARAEEGTRAVQPTFQAAVSPVASATRLPIRAKVAFLLTLLITAWAVFDFPVLKLPLGVLLASYSALLWFRPRILWAVIPAAIPLLDLAPWSGRFYLDEFDFLVMISLAIGYARTRSTSGGSRRDLTPSIALSLLALCFAIGTMRGLLPLQIPDANSFTNYYSPYNALRIAKGALWAALLFALMPRFTAGGREISALFARGMVVGLVGTVAIVIWERWVFSGMLNFTDAYRVTGPFSQMHTGGADIETYLTAALPFAVVLLASTRAFIARLGSGVLVIGATYALMVTFSRAGYAGFGVALVVVSLAWWRTRRGSLSADPRLVSERFAEDSRVYRGAAPIVLVALAVAVAVPIFNASFAQERMSRLGSDLAVRQAHWQDALAMRDAGLLTAVLGMGIGRFPEAHYWRSTEPKAASYRLEREAGNTFLRLGTGYPLYMEQLVAVVPQQEYTLHLDVRSPQVGAGVSIALCEKWLLTSAHCVTQTASVAETGQWQSFQLPIASGDIGGGPWLARPSVKLSVFNSSAAVVDIDNVHLMAGGGGEVVNNGDFSHATDRWFFSVDQDLPWHVWSMPVAILFDQGWFGVGVLGLLVGIALKRSAQDAWQGDLVSGAILASLAGIAVIATVDTIVDAPRFLLLCLLLVLLPIRQIPASASPAPGYHPN